MNPLDVSVVFKEIKTSWASSSYSSNSLSLISGGEVVPNFRSSISNVLPSPQLTRTLPTYLLYRNSNWFKSQRRLLWRPVENLRTFEFSRPFVLNDMLQRKIKQPLKKVKRTTLASQSVEPFCLGKEKNRIFTTSSWISTIIQTIF